MTLGRALENDFPFRNELLLSKRHMAFEPQGGSWFIEDLGSLNGTVLNGRRLRERHEMKPGARIEAGGLEMKLVASQPTPAEPKVTFLTETQTGPTVAASIDSSMNLLSGGTPGRADSGRLQINALSDASSALSESRPLEQMFPLILNLAMNTVRARRGLVLELEDGQLTTRAIRGGDFRISRAVLDRVMDRRESLLVQDVSPHEAPESSAARPKDGLSVLAVPLLTETELMGLIYVDSPSSVRAFSEVDLSLLTVLGHLAAVSIVRARREKKDLANKILELDRAQAIEVWMDLLPRQAPDVPGFEIAGTSIPCRSVGGDYFDYLPMPGGRLAILLGDMAGKGMAAALLMSGVKWSIQMLADEGPELGALVTRLNSHLARPPFPANRFLTLFMLVLDPATGEFGYVNAGHNPPYLIHAGGELQPLTDGGPVLGVLKRISYQALSERLQPGETLVIYSDGLTEARSPSGEEFGEERLEALLRTGRGGAEHTMDAIFRSVRDFASSAPFADDLTVVVVHRQTCGPPLAGYNDP